MTDTIKLDTKPSASYALVPTWERLDALYNLEENWNGSEVSAPAPTSIEQARQWIEVLYRDVESLNCTWLAPHVTADEDGTVVFEWVKQEKWLSVYVSATSVCYIKSWGASILEEMADGILTTVEDRLTVWLWLQG